MRGSHLRECLAYVSWSGTAKPSADSPSQTEKLLAEPEVAQMFAKIEGILVQKLAEGKAQNPQMKMISDVYPAAKAVLTRPAALFLSKVAVAPQGPSFEGGAIFRLDDDTAMVVATLEALQKLIPPAAVEKAAIDKFSVYKIKTPGPLVTWGVAGKYLVVGVGEGQFEAILKRARGGVPAWLAKLRKQAPVSRVSTVLYLNVKQAVDQFAPLGGPQVKTALDATGLAGLTSLATVTGFHGADFETRTLVGIDGEANGVFHIVCGGKPLTAADLAPIPCDATIAIAARCDLDDVLATVLKVAGQIDRGSQARLPRPSSSSISPSASILRRNCSNRWAMSGAFTTPRAKGASCSPASPASRGSRTMIGWRRPWRSWSSLRNRSCTPRATSGTAIRRNRKSRSSSSPGRRSIFSTPERPNS